MFKKQHQDLCGNNSTLAASVRFYLQKSINHPQSSQWNLVDTKAKETTTMSSMYSLSFYIMIDFFIIHSDRVENCGLVLHYLERSFCKWLYTSNIWQSISINQKSWLTLIIYFPLTYLNSPIPIIVRISKTAI